jgi:hypothetical protein
VVVQDQEATTAIITAIVITDQGEAMTEVETVDTLHQAEEAVMNTDLPLRREALHHPTLLLLIHLLLPQVLAEVVQDLVVEVVQVEVPEVAEEDKRFFGGMSSWHSSFSNQSLDNHNLLI